MNKLFKFALAALPIVMLASCAKDDLESEVPKAEKSETRYIKVTLTSPNASPVTRAWSDDNTDGKTNVVGDKGFYADGTEDENKIRTLEFYFYTQDKQFHSYVPMTSSIENPPTLPEDNPRQNDVTNPDGTTTPGSPNITGFYHCNVPITLTQGQALPRYVVCIVNSVEGTAYQGSTLERAQRKILNALYAAENDADPQGNNPKEYFGMSNSVYYGEDQVTGETGVLIMAVPFTTDKLLTETQLEQLEKQAEGTGDNKNEIEKFTINIPVERYAAKVKLDLSSLNSTTMPDYPATYSTTTTTTDAQGKTTTTTTYSPIKLKFTPKKWGVNATERTFYFLKSFRTSATVDGTNPEGVGDRYATEAELNSILFPGWNAVKYKRCFWARTPGYYKDNYPLTGDDIEDLTDYDAAGNPVYEKDENGNYIYPFDLWYKSWNECKDVNSVNDALAEYVKETTMKVTRLTGEGLADQYLPTASLPAVMLLGQYTVGDEAKPKDFYLYGKSSATTPVVYSDHSSDDKKIEGTGDIRAKMFEDQTIILIKNGDTYTSLSKESTLTNADDKAAFVIEHPKEAVRKFAAQTDAITGGALHIASDIVVLQLKEVPKNTELWFFNPMEGEDGGSYQKIEARHLTYVNLLLLQNLGGAHYYKDGMAYFTAPIQHWGWYRSDNFNTTQVEVKEIDESGNEVTTKRDRTFAEWDWSQMKTGDFGVVRNHVYTMKIGSITGLGNGIADPDDPIVPPADKVNYVVHFHVNIQRWAVLPTQEWNW